MFLISTEVVYSSALWLLHGWCHVKYCCLGACSVYTIQQRTSSLQCHFIHRVYVCLAVTCPGTFGRMTGIFYMTRGWNRYRNKSQHRKLTLEKKIVPPLLRGLEPGTFRSRIQRSNHSAISDPMVRMVG